MSVRYANMLRGLERRHNDTLAQVDVIELARQFRLPADLVARRVREEIERRAARDAA